MRSPRQKILRLAPWWSPFLWAFAAWIALLWANSALQAGDPNDPPSELPRWKAQAPYGAADPGGVPGAAFLSVGGQTLGFGESAVLDLTADSRGSARFPVRLGAHGRSPEGFGSLHINPSIDLRFAWDRSGFAVLHGLEPGASYRVAASLRGFGTGSFSGKAAVFKRQTQVQSVRHDCRSIPKGGCVLAIGSPRLSRLPDQGPLRSALVWSVGSTPWQAPFLVALSFFLSRALLGWRWPRSILVACGAASRRPIPANPGDFG